MKIDTRDTAIILFFIILAAIGWSAYKSRAGMSTVPEGTATSTPAGTELALSASFGCADGTHFIAEFPAGKVQIVIDGEVVRTLSQVGAEGYRFEDSSYAYVFAGEGAAVLNKATGGKTTCEQPRDPNNAPINFGDAAEGGAGFGEAIQQRDIALIVSESILGTWKSNEDAKFVRVFKTNGIAEDLYDGKVVTTGKWQAFSSLKPLVVPFTMENNVVYIQMTENSQSGALYFKVSRLTPEFLDLIYMDRGNANTFTRVK